jgi:hypothetical protein
LNLSPQEQRGDCQTNRHREYGSLWPKCSAYQNRRFLSVPASNPGIVSCPETDMPNSEPSPKATCSLTMKRHTRVAVMERAGRTPTMTNQTLHVAVVDIGKLANLGWVVEGPSITESGTDIDSCIEVLAKALTNDGSSGVGI